MTGDMAVAVPAKHALVVTAEESEDRPPAGTVDAGGGTTATTKLSCTFQYRRKKPAGYYLAGFEKAAENIDIQESRNGHL